MMRTSTSGTPAVSAGYCQTVPAEIEEHAGGPVVAIEARLAGDAVAPAVLIVGADRRRVALVAPEPGEDAFCGFATGVPGTTGSFTRGGAASFIGVGGGAASRPPPPEEDPLRTSTAAAAGGAAARSAGAEDRARRLMFSGTTDRHPGSTTAHLDRRRHRQRGHKPRERRERFASRRRRSNPRSPAISARAEISSLCRDSATAADTPPPPTAALSPRSSPSRASRARAPS